MKVPNKTVSTAIKAWTLAAATLASLGAAAGDQSPSPYMMAVLEHTTLARDVLQGQYHLAIARAADRRSWITANFAVQNNLCVAYAKSGDPEKAKQACDSAVKISREAGTAQTAKAGKSKRNLAIALSNRGVLYATGGNLNLARRDFVEATQLDETLAEPQSNLVRVLQSMQMQG